MIPIIILHVDRLYTVHVLSLLFVPQKSLIEMYTDVLNLLTEFDARSSRKDGKFINTLPQVCSILCSVYVCKYVCVDVFSVHICMYVCMYVCYVCTKLMYYYGTCTMAALISSLVPRLYPCARTQTFRCISDWSEYERTGKAWERDYLISTSISMYTTCVVHHVRTYIHIVHTCTYTHIDTCTCVDVDVRYSYTFVRIIYEAAQPRVDCAKQRITDLYPILPIPVNTVMTSYLSLVFVN